MTHGHHVLPILIAVACLASPARAETLEEVLRRAMAKHDVPAMAALCLHGDVVQERAEAGARQRGGETPIGANDRWHLGSCTKAMTATLVARLVERKVLRWKTTIGEALPEIKDAVRPEYLGVTLEQLLTNRGGIPGEVGKTDAWKRAWIRSGTVVEQRRRFAIDVMNMSPPVEPGTYLYSNQGFAIAGHMCETITGVPYEALMQEEVFEPLGMTSAGFGAPAALDVDQPIGHRAGGEPGPPAADNPPAISPAGRVHCSLADWSRFVAAHLLGNQGRSRYLSRRTFRTLHRQARGKGNRYAMGWGIAERPWGGRILAHAGSNTLWYCLTYVAPEKDIAVLVACNQGGDAGRLACDEVADALVAREAARRAAPRDRRQIPDGAADGRDTAAP